MRYVTKPFEIEAVQWTGCNHEELREFTSGDLPNFWTKEEWIGNWEWDGGSAAVYDKLHDTWICVRTDDYVVKGMKGEFYPCDPEVFETKYEPKGDLNQLRKPTWTKDIVTPNEIRKAEGLGGPETD